MASGCYWFVRMIQSLKAHLAVFLSLTAEAILDKLWATAAYSLGNRTTSLPATHQPFWGGNLITNLCDFLPEVGREGLPLLPGPSVHQQTVVFLTTLMWDHFPTYPLTRERHRSSAWAVLWVVLCLVPGLVLILAYLADGPSWTDDPGAVLVTLNLSGDRWTVDWAWDCCGTYSAHLAWVLWDSVPTFGTLSPFALLLLLTHRWFHLGLKFQKTATWLWRSRKGLQSWSQISWAPAHSCCFLVTLK